MIDSPKRARGNDDGRLWRTDFRLSRDFHSILCCRENKFQTAFSLFHNSPAKQGETKAQSLFRTVRTVVLLADSNQIDFDSPQNNNQFLKT
jgi:hypothetical protein